MAEGLLETKLKEAVERARGDKQAAVRLLIAWSEKDETLFRALVQPFLQGILFHLVDRTMKHITGDPVAPRAASADAKPAAKSTEKPTETSAQKTVEKSAEKLVAKPAAKPAEKATPQTPEQAAEKLAAKMLDLEEAKTTSKSPSKAPAKAFSDDEPPMVISRSRKQGELPPAVIDALVERWGAKIPVATQPVLDHPPRTVEEALEGLGKSGPPPPGKASGRHQSGMRLIAKVQRMKRSTIG